MSNKLYNKKFIKVSRQHYGQLQLLVDWLVYKAGGTIELPPVKVMQERLNDMDSVLIPHADGTATATLRKAEHGLPS